MYEGSFATSRTSHAFSECISKIIDPGKKELLRERNMKSLPDEYEAECIPGLEAFAIDELRSFEGVLPHSLSHLQAGIRSLSLCWQSPSFMQRFVQQSPCMECIDSRSPGPKPFWVISTAHG